MEEADFSKDTDKKLDKGIPLGRYKRLGIIGLCTGFAFVILYYVLGMLIVHKVDDLSLIHI